MNINFFYSVDRTMDFYRAQPHATELIFLTPDLAIKIQFSINSTAHYIHLRLDLPIGARFSDRGLVIIIGIKI